MKSFKTNEVQVLDMARKVAFEKETRLKMKDVFCLQGPSFKIKPYKGLERGGLELCISFGRKENRGEKGGLGEKLELEGEVVIGD